MANSSIESSPTCYWAPDGTAVDFEGRRLPTTEASDPSLDALIAMGFEPAAAEEAASIPAAVQGSHVLEGMAQGFLAIQNSTWELTWLEMKLEIWLQVGQTFTRLFSGLIDSVLPPTKKGRHVGINCTLV